MLLRVRAMTSWQNIRSSSMIARFMHSTAGNGDDGNVTPDPAVRKRAKHKVPQKR